MLQIMYGKEEKLLVPYKLSYFIKIRTSVPLNSAPIKVSDGWGQRTLLLLLALKSN